MLVSTVTPSTSGVLSISCAAASAVAIMARPPLVCMVNMATSSWAAVATARANGVWNVMEFQVQKNSSPFITNSAHDVRAGTNEKFLSNLECAYRRRQLAGEIEGCLGVGHVQGDDDGVAHCTQIES